MQKVYWALAEGAVVDETAGEWRDTIRKVPDRSRAERVEASAEGAKEAVTLVRVLRRSDGLTWLELRPRTGRMHQLRLQASLRGHPVVGDALYGSSRPFGPDAAESRDRVIALHARSLTFRHPFRDTPLTVEAEPPAAWADHLA